jgi:hypothetical protein
MELVDRSTRRVTDTFSDAYDKTQIAQYLEKARDALSTPTGVNALAVLFELYHLRSGILPNKKFFDIPATPYIKDTKTAVPAPDVFLLVDGKFWAPFTLWLLTSLIFPALVSYFVNLPIKASPSHGYGTRRATASPTSQYDTFMFNIAKGLICYLVYAQHFQLFGLYSNYTIATVNESIYGGYNSMLTTAGIGAATSLYEAVLKK